MVETGAICGNTRASPRLGAKSRKAGCSSCILPSSPSDWSTTPSSTARRAGTSSLIPSWAVAPALLAGLRLVGKFAGIDELVAPQAVHARRQRADDAEDIGQR